jgi:N-acetyl-anhydromuramyl-L-alanine amidase AmpD
MWTDLKPIDLNKVKVHPYPEDKYFHEEFEKKQLILHHTVSGPGEDGDINTWIAGKDNVGTCIILDRDGTPYQLFSSKFWAYHLAAGNHELDRHSVGIEIDNWGQLTLGDGSSKIMSGKLVQTQPGKFYNYYGYTVDCPVQEYKDGFRGSNYFEKYTNAQIQTVGELLLFWGKKFNIPLDYHATMFDLSQEALSGTPGVWSHTSYRKDKSDVHPQNEMIEMLKVLKSIS